MKDIDLKSYVFRNSLVSFGTFPAKKTQKTKTENPTKTKPKTNPKTKPNKIKHKCEKYLIFTIQKLAKEF